MRKVNLTMNELEKYEVIKRLSEGHINKATASVKIGCTIRHISRLLIKYKAEGKEAFSHGNKGRKPAHAIPDKIKQEIVTIYNNKYWDANLTHSCELLKRNDGICVSPSLLRNILFDQAILSPRATKHTRKRLRTILQKQYREAKGKKKLEIKAAIIATEDAHSRRPRAAYAGELLQMDASVHLWYGNCKSHLHIAIDDHTGRIVGAWFDEQETLKGYYNVLHQTLTKYGIPNLIFTDNRTVFEYHSKKKKDIGEDTFTQFGYACKQLGIELKTSSIPQAKGRVERLFQTLQSRLPVELRLEGITTKKEANAFLNSYIKEYNAKFALPMSNHIKSVFITQPGKDIINQTLAIITPRTVDSGHCLRFHNKFFKTMDKRGLQTHYRKGTKGLVIQTFNGQLLFSTNDLVYELEEIPRHEAKSQVFDNYKPETKPRKRHLPSPKHPWRSDVFAKHIPYDYFPDGIPA